MFSVDFVACFCVVKCGFMIGFIVFLGEKNKKKVTNKCELRNHLCKDVGVRYLYSNTLKSGQVEAFPLWRLAFTKQMWAFDSLMSKSSNFVLILILVLVLSLVSCLCGDIETAYSYLVDH